MRPLGRTVSRLGIGINNQRDLPEEFLTKLYHNIVNNEIKMHDEAEERRKFEAIMSAMTGKTEGLEKSGRVVKYQFFSCHIFDPEKVDPHRHERVVFILNDMLLMTKLLKKKYQLKARMPFNQMTVTQLPAITGTGMLLGTFG